MPSESPETVVRAAPVSFIASQSPGSMILSIFENSAGSFSFTQASLAAVKFPGEFMRWPRHFSVPMDSKAAWPYSTARESHQIIAGRSTFWFLSTQTSPCIW